MVRNIFDAPHILLTSPLKKTRVWCMVMYLTFPSRYTIFRKKLQKSKIDTAPRAFKNVVSHMRTVSWTLSSRN